MSPASRWTVVFVGTIVIVNAFGCALLNGIDKVSKTPGLEEALERQANQKRPGKFGEREPVLSNLRATPQIVDFGAMSIGQEGAKTVTVFNPSDFTSTVVAVTVQGTGFAMASPQLRTPLTSLRMGGVSLAVRFQPANRKRSAGLLVLLVDSAGGRVTRIELKGLGI